MTFWSRFTFTWWLGHFISRYVKVHFMLIKYMCDSKSDTLRMRYPFQSTDRPISHRNVWSFRVYMIPLRDFVPEWDSRPGTTTGMNSRRHGILWWYHVSKCRAISIADVPDGTNLSFHLLGMIADHRRNLGRVGKIETVPIIQICPRPSQTIGDIYDFEFSLVSIEIWDSRERVKSPIVWDFPDTRKPGLIDLVTVFDAILTSRKTCEKLQCL